MRTLHENLSPKTVAASALVQWTSTDVPNPEGIVGLHFAFTGAGNTLANVTRIRLKADGIGAFLDLPPAFIRAYAQRFALSNVAIAAAAATFSIWLSLPDLANEDAADESQWPGNRAFTAEVQFGAGAGAGTGLLAYTKTNIPRKWYPALYSNPMNFAASQSNQRWGLTEDGEIRGIGINSTGLSKVILSVGSEMVFDGIDGTELIESQAWADAPTLTDPVVRELVPARRNGGKGEAMIDSAAAWAGTANEFFIYALRAA